jgi:hypothetical protein
MRRTVEQVKYLYTCHEEKKTGSLELHIKRWDDDRWESIREKITTQVVMKQLLQPFGFVLGP